MASFSFQKVKAMPTRMPFPGFEPSGNITVPIDATIVSVPAQRRREIVGPDPELSDSRIPEFSLSEFRVST